MEALTIAQIKEKYPNEWVLVGNPLLDEESVETIVNRLISGIVLLHTKDKSEIGKKGFAARQGYNTATIIYTGEFPKNRRWLL